jgi:hypothetical protein
MIKKLRKILFSTDNDFYCEKNENSLFTLKLLKSIKSFRFMVKNKFNRPKKLSGFSNLLFIDK